MRYNKYNKRGRTSRKPLCVLALKKGISGTNDEGKPSFFAAPFSIVAGANFKFYTPCTNFKPKVCAICE